MSGLSDARTRSDFQRYVERQCHEDLIESSTALELDDGRERVFNNGI